MLGLRLDASITPASRVRAAVCTECGAEFTPLKAHGDFCGDACRKAWNNRRMVRGAELYDLFMALRYDRPAAQALGLWRLICRMAMGFRDQDIGERDGRKSWRDPRTVARRHAYLHATTVGRGIAGRRGRK